MLRSGLLLWLDIESRPVFNVLFPVAISLHRCFVTVIARQNMHMADALLASLVSGSFDLSFSSKATNVSSTRLLYIVAIVHVKVDIVAYSSV